MEVTVDSEFVRTNIKLFSSDKLPKTIEECHNDAGNIVEAEAKALCPVRDGQLIQSIKHEVVGTNKVEIGSNVDYAPYVEVGTGIFSTMGNGRKQVPWRYKDAKGNWHTTYGMVAQPYLQPALEQNIARIADCFKEKI